MFIVLKSAFVTNCVTPCPLCKTYLCEGCEKKIIYVCGDVLNVNDLIVRYYDIDGTVKKVTDYTVNADNIDMCVSGVKTLTVTYNGFSTKAKLKVNEARESSRKENVKISGIIMSDSVYTGKPISYSGGVSV